MAFAREDKTNMKEDRPFPESRFIDTEGFRTHYRRFSDEKKDKIPLLFLHGALDSTATWNLVAKGLAQERRLLLPDLIGHGHTERNTQLTYTIPSMLMQILALQDGLEIEKIHLGGNSMGGILSVLYCIEHPERVESVIIVDGGIGGFKSSVPPWLFSTLTSQVFLALVKYLLRPMEVSLFRYLFSQRIGWMYQVPEEVLKAFLVPHKILGSSRATGFFLRSYFSFFSQQDDRRLMESFRALAKPTLLVWGEKDRIVAPNVAEILHKNLPESKLIIIPNCGHCPQLEHPEQFVSGVNIFLEDKG
jgi:pimeloyl-ACP methyl ester carboxylesterase